MEKVLLVLSLIAQLSAWSQDYRYTNTLFQSTTKTANVVYGNAAFVNGPLFTVESSTTNQNLLMDIYRPTGDTFGLRPAVIMAHPGGFLLGSRTVDDMNAIADTLARKGYVTATIDYRKGFNLTSNQELHSIRAVYRGIQDGRTAIRFLRANAALYGIDPTKIYFIGSSAGSFIGLHAAFLDTTEEIPTQAGTVNYFNITPPFNHTAPNLGPLDIGDNLLFNGKPDAVVALWGALQNTDLITPNNNTPVLLVHGEDDAIVSFNAGSPFNFPAFPFAYGSNPINTKLNALGFTTHETYFVPGEGHEFHGASNGNWSNGMGGNTFYPIILNRIYQFFWKQHKPTADFSWNATANDISFTDTSLGSLAWWWDFGDGAFSNEQNPTHLYAIPGNYQVKLYVENDIKSWDEITQTVQVAALTTAQNKHTHFLAVPNPTQGDMQLSWHGNYSGVSWQLFDVVGNLVGHQVWVENGASISLANLSKGVYFLKIAAESSFETIKIIKQ